MSRKNIKEIYKIGKGLYPKEGLGQEEILLLEVEIWLLDSWANVGLDWFEGIDPRTWNSFWVWTLGFSCLTGFTT